MGKAERFHIRQYSQWFCRPGGSFSFCFPCYNSSKADIFSASSENAFYSRRRAQQCIFGHICMARTATEFSFCYSLQM